MSDSISIFSSASVEGFQFVIPDIPKLYSSEALQYLEDIVPEEDFRYIMFDDSLITVSDTGKHLGEFTVSVKPTRYKGLECFLIHVNSNGSINGVPCGTTVVSYVTKCLETLEQQYHEYVKLDYCPLDRKTYLYRQNDSYLVNRVITEGKEIYRTTKTISLEQMRGFISEGSNILLHRLLIEKPMDKSLQFVSFDSDGNLCSAIYKPLDGRTQTVGDVVLPVKGIERTINSVSALTLSWQSYFMKDCHLTSRVQIGSPVVMKLESVPIWIDRVEEVPKPIFVKKQLNWQEDIQLYSMFLDRMEELKVDHATFMRCHPELRALLADFLQFLLLRKPDDVIAFAATYFSAFSLSVPDRPPYLASTTPLQYPASYTTQEIIEMRTLKMIRLDS